MFSNLSIRVYELREKVVYDWLTDFKYPLTGLATQGDGRIIKGVDNSRFFFVVGIEREIYAITEKRCLDDIVKAPPIKFRKATKNETYKKLTHSVMGYRLSSSQLVLFQVLPSRQLPAIWIFDLRNQTPISTECEVPPTECWQWTWLTHISYRVILLLLSIFLNLELTMY